MLPRKEDLIDKTSVDMQQDDGYVSNASSDSADDQATLVNAQTGGEETKMAPSSARDSGLSLFGSRHPLMDIVIFYILMTTLNGASISIAQSKPMFMGRPPLRLEWIALCLLSCHKLFKTQLNSPRLLIPHVFLLILCDSIVYRVFINADQGRLAWLLPISANATVYYHMFMLAKGVSSGAGFGLVLLAVTMTEALGSSRWWMDDSNTLTSLSVIIPLHTVGYGLFTLQASLFEHFARWRNERYLRNGARAGLEGAKFRFFHHESENNSQDATEVCIIQVTPSTVTLQVSATDEQSRFIRVNGLPWSDQLVERVDEQTLWIQIGGLLHSTEYEIQVANSIVRVCTSPKESRVPMDEDVIVEAPAESLPPPSTDDAELVKLENSVAAAENERNELSNRLKKLRKDEQKNEASLRSEVDALRRGLERSATTDHRAKQRVLALQEQVKQLSKRIEQVQDEITQSAAGQHSVEEGLAAVHTDWLNVKDLSDAHHKTANDKIAEDTHALNELESMIGGLNARYEKMQTKKHRLETIEMPCSEKKLADLKQELMAATLQRRYAERQREGDYPKLPNPYLSTTNIEALDHAAEDMTRRNTELGELIEHETLEMDAISAELEGLRGKGIAAR